MAIRSLKTGQFSRSTLVGNPVIMPGSYESIATVSVGAGGTSSITFSNIPSTYSHLQIRMLAKTNFTTYANDNLILRFNGDSGSNYNMHNLYGTGASIGSQSAGTQSFAYISYVIGNTVSSSVFSSIVLDIVDYKSTNKNKTFRYISGADTNDSNGTIALGSGLWFATPAAITQITLSPGDGTNIMQYSHFALYGVN
jgi:hypothetical protein